jgi:hypothetical protein
MREHGSLPQARQDGLLEEMVGEELLIYDQSSHTAHCLSPIAARVWRHCDGKHDATELAQLAGASESLVADALHKLHEKDLIAADPELTQSIVPGISRREAVVQVARVGAAAAGASLIVSATAATPAMAASGKGLCEEAPEFTCCECDNFLCLENIGSQKLCEQECVKAGHNYVKWIKNWKCIKP